MKIERAQEIYSDYEEGTLSPPMKLALEQHFEGDSAAREDYEDFSRLFGLLSETSTDEVEVPYGFRAKILERVAMEDAYRQASRKTGFLESLRNLFLQPGSREASGALAAVIVVAIVAGVVMKQPRTSVHTGGMGPALGGVFTTSPEPVTTVIQGVNERTSADGTIYHDFRVHLPDNMPNAYVNAYAISATDQILDPAVRERDAMPVLKSAQYLTNDETMKIPVALVRQVPAGSTLNILVEWRTNGATVPTGAQVIFAPLTAVDSVTPSTAPASNGNFFDSLQTIASAYHATVIADATTAPITTVHSWSPGNDVTSALNTVASAAGYAVKPLDKDTYLVYRIAQ